MKLLQQVCSILPKHPWKVNKQVNIYDKIFMAIFYWLLYGLKWKCWRIYNFCCNLFWVYGSIDWTISSRNRQDLVLYQHTMYVISLSNISMKTNFKQITRVELKFVQYPQGDYIVCLTSRHFFEIKESSLSDTRCLIQDVVLPHCGATLNETFSVELLWHDVISLECENSFRPVKWYALNN
jgi:hypothetical protein